MEKGGGCSPRPLSRARLAPGPKCVEVGGECQAEAWGSLETTKN